MAFIKLREQSTPITVIESAIKQSLRDFEHPKLFVVEDIPLLINGKVDRQQLLRIYEEKQMNTGNISFHCLMLRVCYTLFYV